MKKTIAAKITALLTALLLLAAAALPAAAAPATPDKAKMQEMFDKTAAALLAEEDEPYYKQEWMLISMVRGGYAVPDAYMTAYLKALEAELKDTDGDLGSVTDWQGNAANEYTNFSRVVLLLTALGLNPADFAGYDVLSPLAEFDAVVEQGLNGAVYALLALDSGKYPDFIGADATTRDKLVAHIVSKELKDGGFSWDTADDTPADVFFTASAVTALYAYRSKEGVQAVIDRALDVLSELQDDKGGFEEFIIMDYETSEGEIVPSPENVALALMMLGAMNKDAAAEAAFIKENGNLLTSLASHYLTEGGFDSYWSGAGEMDSGTSEQALRALADYLRLKDGKTSYFVMTDTAGSITALIAAIDALPKTVSSETNAAAVDAAAAAYDALPGYLKAYITNTAALNTAKAAAQQFRAAQSATTTTAATTGPASPPTGRASHTTAAILLVLVIGGVLLLVRRRGAGDAA